MDGREATAAQFQLRKNSRHGENINASGQGSCNAVVNSLAGRLWLEQEIKVQEIKSVQRDGDRRTL